MSMLRAAVNSLLGRTPVATRRQRTQALIEHLRSQGMRIGEDVALVNVTFDTVYPFLIEIGSRVIITHATILAHDASPVVFGASTRVGRVRIGDQCFVGAGAVVLPGVTIGPRAIVGANAVVSRDVPPNRIVAGAPARVVADVDEWLVRKEQGGELIPWTGGTVPEDEDVERARAEVRRKLGMARSG